MNAPRIVATLGVIGIISGGLLAWANGASEPRIIENRRRETKEAVLSVLPKTKTVKRIKIDGLILHQGKDAAGQSTGYAFRAVTTGFQGDIVMMVGIDRDLEKFSGLKILENIETPGLGNRIDEVKFTDQFSGLNGQTQIDLVKNERAQKSKNEVEAISGATISSRSVVAGLNKHAKKIIQALKKR